MYRVAYNLFGLLLRKRVNSEILQDRHVLTREQHRKTLKLELEIRDSLNRLSTQITTMHNEMSLLPVSISFLAQF